MSALSYLPLAEQVQGPEHQTLKILVVEQDRAIQDILAGHLQRYNGAKFAITSAFSVAEALAILAAEPPHAVLLDLELSDAKGLDTLADIYRVAPFIPIIVIASEADVAVELETLRYGAQDYIVRGEISGTLLARAITRGIERKLANDKLRSSLEEKEVLLREVHHRVKNNLQVVCSILSLASRTLSDPGMRAVLDESRNRVLSMALVHDQLYRTRDFSAIDLSSYVEAVVRSLCSNILELPDLVTLKFDLPYRPVDPDTAISCGLIINELVTNSLRHGFADGREGVIEVILEAPVDSCHCRLVVKDTGPGLPSIECFENPRSLGLDLVKVLTAQIDGEIKYLFEDGAIFLLSFETPRRTIRGTSAS